MTQFYHELDDNKINPFKGLLVIGDVHGMLAPFQRALDHAAHQSLYIVSLGDLVDYGPQTKEVIELSYDFVKFGQMSIVLGNHEHKLSKYFKQLREGNVRVKIKESLQASITSFANDNAAIDKFLDLHKDMANIIKFKQWYFTHAALHPDFLNKPEYFGEAYNFSLFGEVDKVKPFRENGFPNRVYNWIPKIPADVKIMVGHDIRSAEKPVEDGSVIFLDTGCGKDGVLHCAQIDKQGNLLSLRNFGK